jgi:hypothetical protein
VTEHKLNACEADLVNRLRHMSLAFSTSYPKLTDKSGIWLKVRGFEKIDRSQSSADSIESHGIKPFYERMLAEWERSADKENLAREDFLRIQRSLRTMPGVTAAFQNEAGELSITFVAGLIEIIGLFF